MRVRPPSVSRSAAPRRIRPWAPSPLPHLDQGWVDRRPPVRAPRPDRGCSRMTRSR